jgi:hypothetical protein
MIVQLHSNGRKDHLCHQVYLQMTSLQDKLKYQMYAKSNESTAILPKIMMMVHLHVVQTPKIGSTAMGTWIIQLAAKTTGRHTLNQI